MGLRIGFPPQHLITCMCWLHR